MSLPAWAANHPRLRDHANAGAFRFAAASQSLLLLMLTAAAFAGRPQGVAAYAFTGYVFAMVVNAFAPHLLATVVLRRYMPGTATGLLLNLPLGVLFLQRSLDEGFVVLDTLAWAAPLTALLVLLSIPPLFAAGRWYSRRNPRATM